MSDFIKQNIAFIVAALIAWMTWSGLSTEGDQKQKEKERRTPIAERFLEVRPDDQPPVEFFDPFRMTAALELPDELISEDDPDDAEDSEDSEEHEGAAVVVPLGAAAQAAQAGETTDEAPGEDWLSGWGWPGGRQDRAPEVELWVDAVMSSASGGNARICGASVKVGEEVPGVDDASPPVLLAIKGVSVELVYRDVRYVLSIDDDPLVVGGRGRPEETDTGSPSLADVLGGLTAAGGGQ